MSAEIPSVARLEKVVDLNLIKPKNALLKSQRFNDLLALFRQKVAEYPATHQLKSCQEFLLYVTKIVEEVVKKSEGINKKELVINLFKALFGLPDAEVKVLDASIEFLWSNGLICKIKSSKKAVRWFRKKVECLL